MMPFDRKSITPEEAWKLSIKERRYLVADLVEYESELLFNMNEWAYVPGTLFTSENVLADPASCGTSACIAGTVSFFLNPVFTARLATGEIGENTVSADAAAFMGLTVKERIALFEPSVSIVQYGDCCSPVGLSDIDRKMAASCIRHFAETGEIDWFRAYEETRK